VCVKNKSLWSRCLLGYFSISRILCTNVEHRWNVNLQGNVEIPVPVPFVKRKFLWTALGLKPDLHVMGSADRHLSQGSSLGTGVKDLNHPPVQNATGDRAGVSVIE
jgi:hypothetical protein